MVHFPIGLLVAAALAEALFLVKGRTLFDAAGRGCVSFGALGAVPAATLGWFLAGPRLTDSDWILAAHRWLGTSTAAWAVLVLILSEVSRRPGRPDRGAFRLALLLNAVLVLATGFFGGALMHGLDYYAWPPQAAAYLRGRDLISGCGGDVVNTPRAQTTRRRQRTVASPRPSAVSTSAITSRSEPRTLPERQERQTEGDPEPLAVQVARYGADPAPQEAEGYACMLDGEGRTEPIPSPSR
jgi:uncharacterized membrane protein